MSFGSPVRNGLGIGLTPSTALSTLRVGGRPAMFLNFIGATALSSNVTFTRATTATFVGSNGLIQTAAIDAPRFDYDPVTLAPKGLLIEEARTNLQTYSEQFDNAIWSGSSSLTIAANSTVSPDGTSTADTGTRTTTGVTENMRRAVTTQAVSTAITLTVYVKANTAGARLYMRNLAVDATTVSGVVQFNPADGTVSTTYGSTYVGKATMTAAGNGWYRCSITGTTTAVIATNFIDIGVTDGTSAVGGNAANSVFIWGAQLEAGAFATSYIPTVASQVTRSADVATMTGTNFSSWYNQNAGTMLCNFILEGQTVGGAVANVWVVDNSGSAANAITLRQGTVITGADATMLTGGAVQVDSNSFATPVNTILKSAFAWSTTSSNLTANGVSLGDGGATTPPTVNQLVLTGSNKWLQQLSFYNTRLPNATLVSLTA